MPIASVLPVLLKYLCLDFFDLDFFTVSSILVLWTEEVLGPKLSGTTIRDTLIGVLRSL